MKRRLPHEDESQSEQRPRKKARIAFVDRAGSKKTETTSPILYRTSKSPFVNKATAKKLPHIDLKKVPSRSNRKSVVLKIEKVQEPSLKRESSP